MRPQHDVKNIFSRVMPLVTFRSSDWDDHDLPQTAIIVCVFICTICSLAGFYDWWRAGSPVWKPLLWALPVAILHALSPDRRVLALVSLGFFLLYGIGGLLHNHDAFGYYVVGLSFALVALLLLTHPSE